jgi:colanic acid/amylovoran biosynthesis glycosyltransferase
MAIKVLHCFAKYLNHTMNWAYKTLSRMPDGSVRVAAPLIVQNKFYNSDFEYAQSPFQWQKVDNEWGFNYPQRIIAGLTRPIYWNNVIQQAKEDGVQLVHAHFAQVGCQVMYDVEKARLPLVVSFYGLDYEMLPFLYPKYKKLYPILFKKARLFLCEGQHGASVLTRMGCPPDKIRVARLGIDCSAIPFQRPEKNNNELRLVQAATMIEKKGYLTTLEALKLSIPRCPNIHLSIVGEKDDKALVAQMRQYIADNNLTDYIEWLDFIPHDQFYSFLGQFHALIHPSQYASNRDCEGGAPIVLLDAQAVGLPVFATTHCDIPDEVVHGRTGWLCAERDAAALANNIEYLYNMQNADYQRFSSAARQHIEAQYDLRTTVPTILNHYADALSFRS